MTDDGRQFYTLLLECGHETPGRPRAYEKMCRQCEAMSRVVSVGEPCDPPRLPQDVTSTAHSRKDGLYLRTFTGSVDGEVKGYQWWCRWCEGRKPLVRGTGKVKGITDVHGQWDAHRATARHQSEQRVREQAGIIADGLRRGSSAP